MIVTTDRYEPEPENPRFPVPSLASTVKGLGAELACLDLDMSLVDSTGVYISLEIETCRRFGFNDFAEITKTHRELQARSGDEIMRGLLDLLKSSLGGASERITFDEFNGYFLGLVSRLDSGEGRFEVKPELIPGSLELVSALRTLELPYRVTTGSKPGMTKILLEHTGLAPFIPRELCTCTGDLPHNKHHSEYWHTVRGKVPIEKCIGFEDNPTAAEWMLEAGFGLVYLRPSREFPGLVRVIEKFGDRIHVVNDWNLLLG